VGGNLPSRIIYLFLLEFLPSRQKKSGVFLSELVESSCGSSTCWSVNQFCCSTSQSWNLWNSKVRKIVFHWFWPLMTPFKHSKCKLQKQCFQKSEYWLFCHSQTFCRSRHTFRKVRTILWTHKIMASKSNLPLLYIINDEGA